VLVVLFLGFVGDIFKGAVSVVKSMTGLGSSSDNTLSSQLLSQITSVTEAANATAQALKAKNDALQAQLDQAARDAQLAAQRQLQLQQQQVAAQQTGILAGLPPWALPAAVGVLAIVLLKKG
jgi:hypothetical protein